MDGGRDRERFDREMEADAVATLFLWVKGGIVGGLSFLVGLGLVHLLLRTRFAGQAALAAAAIGRVRVSTWGYYNAHLVPTDGLALDAVHVVPGGGNTLARLAATDPLLYGVFLLPPALLVVSGYAVAKRRPVKVRWVRAGLAVFVGYFFVAVVFLLVATVPPGQTVPGVPPGTELRPNPWFAIGLAAVGYPAFFAILGSLFGRRAPWTRPSKQGTRRRR
ncbi:hypothetical protein [Haloarchaeobius sp. HRN-SO-5]|uniref:hypothetical protein n=1 Tax=Haloarchaeobius sp. HRN-SO-5 TaxID=3446118 RepID=UPI003EBF0121